MKDALLLHHFLKTFLRQTKFIMEMFDIVKAIQKL